MSRLHRSPAYARAARAVRGWANRHTDVRCWRCRRTKAEHGRPWHAGHTVDGDPLAQPWFSNAEPPPGSWLRAECEECNTREGAKRGNELRRRPGTTRQW